MGEKQINNIHLAETKQNEASDPQKSVWVSASAGTGKTKVLTDRVLRLLLNGANSDGILCITFTKAGANEMQNRISATLKKWTTLNPEELANELSKLGFTKNKLALQRAPLLYHDIFQRKLKIVTIHSFCQSLLTSFTIEANISTNSKIIEDNKSLLMESLSQIISPNLDIFKYLSFQAIIDLVYTLNDPIVIETFMTAPQQDLQFFNFQEIKSFFYPPLKTLSNLHNSLVEKNLNEAISIVIKNGETQESLKVLTSAMITQKGTLRKNILSKKTITTNPKALEIVKKAADHLILFNENKKLKSNFKVTQAVISFLKALYDKYTELKNTLHLLDFNDIISKCQTLLSKTDELPWVAYKLDGGIDHILVDEAQDTSLMQWKIICSLISVILETPGKTFFVVGDDKQSIYGFQGANFKEFNHVENALTHLTNFKKVDLQVSFRSNQAILDVVNKLTSKIGTFSTHISADPTRRGYVEILPILQFNEDSEEIEETITQIEASRIAERIAKLLDSSIFLDSKKRNLQPSDIMLLVQRRTSLTPALVNELSKRKIPVCGADRIKLNEHLITHDFINLARVCNNPLDDFSLACVLKSPFFSITEEEIMNLRITSKLSLWEEVSQTKGKFENISTKINELRENIWLKSPYEIFTTALFAWKTYGYFVKEFFTDGDKIIEEFLKQVLIYQEEHVASMSGFIEWFSKHKTEIKQDLDQEEGVRIMTAHGSKGLQSPVVILADTSREIKIRSTIFKYKDRLLLNLPAKERSLKLQKAQNEVTDELLEENLRLLYVATTRAEDILIVTGTLARKKELKDTSWYNILASSMPKVSNSHISSNIIFSSLYKEYERQPHILFHGEIVSKSIPKQVTFQSTAEPYISCFKEENHNQWHNEPISLIHKWNYVEPLDLRLTSIRGEIIHKVLEISVGVKPPTTSLIKNITHNMLLAKKICFFNEFNKYNDFVEEITANILCCWDNFKDTLMPKKGVRFYKEMEIFIDNSPVRLDVLRQSSTFAEIIDYKTGSQTALSTYRKQLLLYKDAVAKILPSHMEIKCYILWTQDLCLEQV